MNLKDVLNVSALTLNDTEYFQVEKIFQQIIDTIDEY